MKPTKIHPALLIIAWIVLIIQTVRLEQAETAKLQLEVDKQLALAQATAADLARVLAVAQRDAAIARLNVITPVLNQHGMIHVEPPGGLLRYRDGVWSVAQEAGK